MISLKTKHIHTTYLKSPYGFTLIELMVTIVILTILAIITIMVINPAQMLRNSRDAKRLSDMQNIVKALGLYAQQFGGYPGSTSSYGEGENACAACGGWDTSAVDCDSDGKPFIEPLVDQSFFTKIPIDPINSINTSTCSGQHYRYYLYPAGTSGCAASRGRFYVLGVIDMENSSGRHSKSPGWSCPSRDWQSEFEWVTGKFEN